MSLSRRTLLTAAAAFAATGARAQGVAQPAVTDAANRAVAVPASVTKVFPAGPPASIVLYTLVPTAMLGWTRANRVEECAFLLPDVCTRPEVGRLTGRGNTANFETVVALKPDLIVDIGSINPTYVSLADRVQQQTGIPYALLDGRFEGIADTYRKLGALTHTSARAETLAGYTERTVGTIRERVQPIPKEKRPRVYFARGPRGLDTALGGSINVETIEFLGAQNVAAERSGGLTSVSLEQVLLWNPDIIVTIDREFAAAVRTDSGWAPVKAVRENRVHLSPRLPFGWVDFPPSVNRLIGLWWLAKIFYPEQFPEDMRGLTREFYGLFYQVTPTDAQIDSVLDARA